MVGDREDSACANKRRTGIGKRSHFLRPCDTARIDAPCVLDEPINSESFKTYIAQFLVRTLKPGDMVIMDNLGSHKAMRCAGPFGLLARGFSSAALQP